MENSILVLVIASAQTPRYQKLYRLWKQHAQNADPRHFTIRFVFANPNIAENVVEVEQDQHLFVRQKETYIPGIYVKTIQALHHMLRIDSGKEARFRAVLRTNLSTFWHWKRLWHAISLSTAFNDDAPPLYTGHTIHAVSPTTSGADIAHHGLLATETTFVSGTTIVLNQTAARLLAIVGSKHDYYARLHTIDDVLAAWVLQAYGVAASQPPDIKEQWLAMPYRPLLYDLRSAQHLAYRTCGVKNDVHYFAYLMKQYDATAQRKNRARA